MVPVNPEKLLQVKPKRRRARESISTAMLLKTVSLEMNVPRRPPSSKHK
jgi:hypothetical protein